MSSSKQVLNQLLRNGRRGFSLIESMVGITIITIAITGPLTVALGSAQYITNSKNVFIGNSLAQEMVEALRYKRDTIFLGCINSSSFCIAQDIGTVTTGIASGELETPTETAWRIFKQQLNGTTGGKNCFDANGCYFDIANMLARATTTPLMYDQTDNTCNFLMQDLRFARGAIPTATPTDYMYQCPANSPNGSVGNRFGRFVVLESIPSVANAYDQMYNDDIRATVVINYLYGGFSRSVRFTDFMRPRS